MANIIDKIDTFRDTLDKLTGKTTEEDPLREVKVDIYDMMTDIAEILDQTGMDEFASQSEFLNSLLDEVSDYSYRDLKYVLRHTKYELENYIKRSVPSFIRLPEGIFVVNQTPTGKVFGAKYWKGATVSFTESAIPR